MSTPQLVNDRQHSAYLLARLMPLADGSYACERFGIYSERFPTDLIGVVYAVIAAADGPFHEAEEELQRWAKDFYPGVALHLRRG